MQIFSLEERSETWIDALCRLWERSVRATHLFLSEEEIGKIAGYIPEALREIPVLIVATDASGKPAGFMGIAGKKLEMLFIAPEERGKGWGKQLAQYGIRNHSIDEVGVNEQNPLAKGFYEHLGFRAYRRTDRDEQGNPYPILYMRLGRI